MCLNVSVLTKPDSGLASLLTTHLVDAVLGNSRGMHRTVHVRHASVWDFGQKLLVTLYLFNEILDLSMKMHFPYGILRSKPRSDFPWMRYQRLDKLIFLAAQSLN